MRARRLLRLYPPAWRARYGDEFLAVAGDRPLTPMQAIDVVSGALDAWLTAEVRRAAMARPAPDGGAHMPKSLTCSTPPRITRRDAVIGAAVMIGMTILFTAAGLAARARGWDAAREVLLGLSFPAALTVSLPFWMMPGVSRRAQVCLVGVTLAILTAIGVVAALVSA